MAIGGGTVISGNITTIPWGSNSYNIITEMDPVGGSAYIMMGTTQLLSVPYAIYSNTTGGGYSAGSGINVTGTIITNTAPDQAVSLTPGTGISTSGIYPNFTITNTQPNTTHTGDATGSSALTVVKIQGKDISTAAPTTGQELNWNIASQKG